MRELNDFRKSIDNIDEAIICLLSERMRIVQKVGKYKKARNIPALDSKRWNDVLKSKIKKSKELGLDTSLITDIYHVIHRYALKLEKEV